MYSEINEYPQCIVIVCQLYSSACFIGTNSVPFIAFEPSPLCLWLVTIQLTSHPEIDPSKFTCNAAQDLRTIFFEVHCVNDGGVCWHHKENQLAWLQVSNVFVLRHQANHHFGTQGFLLNLRALRLIMAVEGCTVQDYTADRIHLLQKPDVVSKNPLCNSMIFKLWQFHNGNSMVRYAPPCSSSHTDSREDL